MKSIRVIFVFGIMMVATVFSLAEDADRGAITQASLDVPSGIYQNYNLLAVVRLGATSMVNTEKALKSAVVNSFPVAQTSETENLYRVVRVNSDRGIQIAVDTNRGWQTLDIDTNKISSEQELSSTVLRRIAELEIAGLEIRSSNGPNAAVSVLSFDAHLEGLSREAKLISWGGSSQHAPY